MKRTLPCPYSIRDPAGGLSLAVSTSCVKEKSCENRSLEAVEIVPFELSHGVKIGEPGRLFLFAGPCVIQDADLCVRIGRRAQSIAWSLGVPYVFKASFDKANRS